MRDSIRTFVAIKINPGPKLLSEFNTFKKYFKNDHINWVDENNFHLTLRFIGETSREQLYALVDGFEKMAPSFHPFEIKLEGTGYFAAKRNPRVLFAKVDRSEMLEKLAAGIEKVVVEAGFHSELKPFRPHITLGRIKQLESSVSFVEILDNREQTLYQQEIVNKFTLYQSILRPEGPVYKPIETFELRRQ